MLRPSRRVTAAAGFAIVLAMATPALASAHTSGHVGFGVNNSATAVAVHRAATPAAHAVTPAIPSTAAFPSSSSTVVGSVGFIDSEQAGYFWSAARGDSVAETFTGPARVRKAILNLDVVENVLNAGATVDWTVSINGKNIGKFQVVEGQLGPLTEKFRFRRIIGPSYAVKMRVTNEVAGGEGSHTFRYAGTGPHSITLKRR